MEAPRECPAPLPRPRRVQPKSTLPSPGAPLMIKQSGNLNNFVQTYGVKVDRNRVHSDLTDVSGALFSTKKDLSAIVVINEAMSMSWNYFEVEIISPGTECAIGLGVGPFDNRLYGMPGWTAQSFGYHADDGNLFNQSSNVGLPFGPTCAKGDVMGCGIDYEGAATTGYVRLWFTKNSTHVGSPVKAKLPSKGFYSLIGMYDTGAVVKYLGHSQLNTPFSIQLLANYPFPRTLLTTYPQDGDGPNQLALCVGDEVDVSESEWLQGCEWLEGKKVRDGTVGLFCRNLMEFVQAVQPLASSTDAYISIENVDEVYMYNGKPLTFVREPEPWYTCTICQDLVVHMSPFRTTCCAQTLCHNCRDACQDRHSGTCSHCQERWETKRDERVVKLVINMEVLCQNQFKGCQWRGELRHLPGHYEQGNCLSTQTKCPFCSAMMTKRDLFFRHYKVCASWPVLCPHICKERKTWRREELSWHLEDGCDEEIVQCEFVSVGCKAQLMRRELVEHRESAMASHSTLLLRGSIALMQEVKDLKDATDILQHRLSQPNEMNS